MKSVIRIEKKLDEVLKRQTNDKLPLQPLNYAGQSCPLCNMAVTYTPTDVGGNRIMVRNCGCEPVTNELPVQVPGD